jgi:hypothetical protein
MLVYCSETPRAMKGIVKTQLHVFWHSNKKAWVRHTIFSDWYTSYFCPTVKEFCTKKYISPQGFDTTGQCPWSPSRFELI